MLQDPAVSISDHLRASLLPTCVLVPVLALSRMDTGSPVDVVEASEFRLTTASGEVRGIWSATDEGTTLALADDSGLVRCELVANSGDGSMILKLTDAEGRPSALWGVEASGAMTLLAVGEQGTPRLVLSSSASEAATLQVNDSRGNRRCQLGLLESGAASFALFEPEGNLVAQLATALGGESFDPALTLYDEETGTMRLSCAVGADTPGVTLFDAEERQRSTWILAGAGGGLSWFDDEGRMRGVFGVTPAGETGTMTFDALGGVTSRQPVGFDRR